MSKQFFVFFLILFLSFSSAGILANGKKNMTEKKSRVLKYEANLSGKQVAPPVMTKAWGKAVFKFSKDGKKLFYRLTVHNIKGVIMAHIHHAPAGKDGPIAVWLYKGKGTGKVNGLLAKGIITNKDVNLDNLKKWISQGDAYVLVHTKKYPAGEIRGIIKQIK